MILYLIMIYLHVVCSRRRDERATLCGYSVTMRFCLKEEYYKYMSYLCEFSVIIYDSILDYDLFTCSLQSPKRREGHALRLFRYNEILLERGVLQIHELSL